MVRCNGRKERDIHPHFDEGGDAGREERIRARVWQHLCSVDQKRWYNDQLRMGCQDLNNPFNIKMWQTHHDVNLGHNLARINDAKQRQEVDRYCGWEPRDVTSKTGCHCSWRNATSSAFVEAAANHPCQGPRPFPTRTEAVQRHITAYPRDKRHALQATAITADGPVKFAWPDTIRPLTLATFGRDADADWCMYKNPVRVVPINMSRKEKIFIR